MKKPTRINAGKPTVKMFKLGAARATNPSPMLMNNKVIKTGKASNSAPKNIMLLQCSILLSMSWLKNGCPIGKMRNDSSTKPKTIKCPPMPKNTSVPRIVKNCDSKGTLPMLGSIMVAMDKPMALAMDCPAIKMADVTTCNINPIKRPIINWLPISIKPLALKGSI